MAIPIIRIIDDPGTGTHHRQPTPEQQCRRRPEGVMRLITTLQQPVPSAPVSPWRGPIGTSTPTISRNLATPGAGCVHLPKLRQCHTSGCSGGPSLHPVTTSFCLPAQPVPRRRSLPLSHSAALGKRQRHPHGIHRRIRNRNRHNQVSLFGSRRSARHGSGARPRYHNRHTLHRQVAIGDILSVTATNRPYRFFKSTRRNTSQD